MCHISLLTKPSSSWCVYPVPGAKPSKLSFLPFPDIKSRRTFTRGRPSLAKRASYAYECQWPANRQQYIRLPGEPSCKKGLVLHFNVSRHLLHRTLSQILSFSCHWYCLEAFMTAFAGCFTSPLAMNTHAILIQCDPCANRYTHTRKHLSVLRRSCGSLSKIVTHGLSAPKHVLPKPNMSMVCNLGLLGVTLCVHVFHKLLNVRQISDFSSLEVSRMMQFSPQWRPFVETSKQFGLPEHV